VSQPVALHRRTQGPIDRKMTAAALAVLGLLLALLLLINGLRASKIGTLSLTTPSASGPREPSIATAIRSRVAVTAAPAGPPAAEPVPVVVAKAPRVASVPVRLRASASAPARASVDQDAPAPAPAPAPTPEPAPNGSRSPEITMFESTNPSASHGEQVEFRWAAGDADGLIAGAVIDFGDGSFVRHDIGHGCDEPVGAPAAEYPSFEHVYERPGDYTVTIKVFSVGQCDAGPLQSADASIGEHVAVLPGVKMAGTLLP
jgi:PKD domain-containing protein